MRMSRCDEPFAIREIGVESIDDLLEVYRACEDFLALGPVPTASLEMIRQDMEISQSEGGTFCGIILNPGLIIGVVDFVRKDYERRNDSACISLLMLAKNFRNQGLGSKVLERVESEIRKDPDVTRIQAGAQVNNPGAIRFWQARGYRIISGPERMKDQTTVYHLEKKLKQA
jgi:RimJ/RimL family protein N-acetyltransferase